MSGADFSAHGGGCHCKAVRFEVELPRAVQAQTCNCSICSATGFIHIIVPASRFRLTSGADRITSYRFNTGIAEHLFCQVCGVKSFYRPRSNPDGWSINARCLDDTTGLEITVGAFDGRNWESHAADLAHLSREAP
jgi:hypothetical protein